MRRLLLALALTTIGCTSTEPVPAVERIQVDPAAVTRLKLRLGDDPAATLGAPAAPSRRAMTRVARTCGGAL